MRMKHDIDIGPTRPPLGIVDRPWNAADVERLIAQVEDSAPGGDLTMGLHRVLVDRRRLDWRAAPALLSSDRAGGGLVRRDQRRPAAIGCGSLRNSRGRTPIWRPGWQSGPMWP